MKVSMIVRTHNAEATLERTLKSALAQIFPQELLEIVVVDDGSTDHTKCVIGAYATKFPNFVAVFASHVGAIAGGNLGFSIARGEYVIAVDSDDEALPNLLHDLSRALDMNPALDLRLGGLRRRV